MLRHPARPLLALTLAALAGCQSAPSTMPGTSLAFGAIAPEPAAQPVAVAAVAAPEAPANAPLEAVPTAAPVAPARSGGSGGGHHHSAPAPAPAPTGSVTIDLTELLPPAPAAQRRILSLPSNLAKLIITVSMPGLPDKTATVTAEELQAGKSSITFDALPTGTCTILIKVFDAADASIGISSRLAAITANQETKAQLYTWLAPDDSSAPNSNRLVFGVNLQAAPPAQAADGPGPAAGTVLDIIAAPGWGGIYADNAGHLYVRTVYQQSQMFYSFIQQLSLADNAQGSRYLVSAMGPPITAVCYDPVHAKMVFGVYRNVFTNNPQDATYILNPATYGLAVDSKGSVFYVRGFYSGSSLGNVVKKTDEGETTMPYKSFSAIALDTSDNVWVNTQQGTAWTTNNEVRKYGPDGTLLQTYTLPFNVSRLVSDNEGGMWACGAQVAHVAADGTLGQPLGIPVLDLCVDAKHHTWLASDRALLELDHDGLELGQYPIQARSITAGDGYIFATAMNGQVLKIQP